MVAVPAPEWAAAAALPGKEPGKSTAREEVRLPRAAAPRPVPVRRISAVDSFVAAVHPNPRLAALIAEPPRNRFDYSDPVGGGAVPLQRVAGRLDEPLSPSFRVRDFASHDGAPYARISGRLVHTLERVRAVAGPLAIVSGYRHRAYNARDEVGGAAGSQHIAGRAADVWAARLTPLELAEQVLATAGCRVGLGLGPNTLHLDLRGTLATWTYPGSALPEADFDAWARQQCGLPPEPAPDTTATGSALAGTVLADSVLVDTSAMPLVPAAGLIPLAPLEVLPPEGPKQRL